MTRLRTRSTGAALLVVLAVLAVLAALIALTVWILDSWRRGPDGGHASPSLSASAPAAVSPAPRAAAPAHGWMEGRLAPQSAGPAPPAAGPRTQRRPSRAPDLQGQDVAAYIARRAPAARAGDAHAAYDVYQATAPCAASADPPSGFGTPDEQAQAAAERSRVRAACARVSPAQVQERMAFLAQAARAGERDARIDFFMEGPQGRAAGTGSGTDAGTESGTQAGADPQAQAWQQEALGFLRAAAAQCDAFALALLANAYDLGELTPHDPRLALTYAVAAGAARQEALSEGQLRERFGAVLDAGEFAAAWRDGVTLAGQACQADGAGGR